MHKHDIETLKRRASQARELAELVSEPEAASRLLGAAMGYEVEAAIVEEAKSVMSDPAPDR